MSDQLKPLFFIVRDNGLITPLIAIDELPHHIRLDGVSRNMSVEDTQGMTNFGKYPARHQQYKVINLNDNAKSTSQSPLDFLSPPSVQISDSHEDETTDRRDYIPVDPHKIDKALQRPKKAYGIQEQKPEVEETKTNTTAQPQSDLAVVKRIFKPVSNRQSEVFQKPEPLPAWKDKTALGTRLPPAGKKVYCTHWMSTGECDFAQQGCMFKHEMPLDIELLNYLGYQDIPKWYRERHGIGKLTAVPGSGAHIAGPQTKKHEAVQTTWNPINNARYVPAFGKRPVNRFARHQIANSPLQLSTKPPPKTGHRQHKNQRNPPAATSTQVTFTPMEGSVGASLLDSRYAPLQPVNADASLLPMERLSLADTPLPTNSDSSSSSGPSDESNTTQTVVGSPVPSRAAFIPQAPPVAYTSNGIRRGSVQSQVSAFSDYETEVFATNQARRVLEDERYARICAQAKEAKKHSSKE